MNVFCQQVNVGEIGFCGGICRVFRVFFVRRGEIGAVCGVVIAQGRGSAFLWNWDKVGGPFVNGPYAQNRPSAVGAIHESPVCCV